MNEHNKNAVLHRSNSLNGPPSATKQVLFIKANDSPSSLSSRPFRKVTRDIAALDFLQNIPMKSESKAQNDSKPVFSASEPSQSHSKPLPASEEFEYDNQTTTGRRLPGYETTVVTMPPLFRYRFTTKYPAASAVVRRWEAMTTQQGLLTSRLFFSSRCGYPLALSTVIRYNGSNETLIKKRTVPANALLPNSTSDYDWRGKSYYRLLHATWAACDPDRDAQDDHPVTPPYLPNYLDDPEFRQGRHRHVVRGDKNIGPVVSSILLFVKPNELKDELNQKFREKHTWLTSADLSLSKIRNLKRETLASCQRLELEVATAALACVYFEKLVLSHYVTKTNRKLYMAVCFLLAVKFNEPKCSDAMKDTIKKILIEIDQVHSIPSREVLTAEFTIYAQLSFALHVPLCEVQPHFTRLLKCIESNPRKYLDEDVFATYSTLVLEEKAKEQATEKENGEEDDDERPSDDDLEDDVLLSDEDGAATANDPPLTTAEASDATMFPWHRMSFATWWKDKRGKESPEPGSQTPESQIPESGSGQTKPPESESGPTNPPEPGSEQAKNPDTGTPDSGSGPPGEIAL